MKVDTHQPYQLLDRDVVMGERQAPYVMRVRDLPNQDKPREKLARLGPKHLTVAELVAVLLGVGTRKEEVMAMAERILREYGEKAIIHEASPANLAQALDIPLAKACQIVASFELGRRFFEHQGGRPVYVRTASQAYKYLGGMGSLQKEQLRGLYLNSRYQVIHDEIISVGSLTANIVHPREVFRPALERGAVALLIAHNHPSGSLSATSADHEVTRQIGQAGEILGIDLLDHLIITNRSFASIIGETRP